jgi:hypothetical protein
MARLTIGLAAAVAALGLAAPVAAQSTNDDVRCLLASNYFARTEKDPAKRQLAMSSSAFYLGRLDARISTDQLKSTVIAQAKTMTIASAAPIMNNCVKRLIQKGGTPQTLAPGASPQAPKAPTKPK